MNAEALANVQITWPDGESINLPTLWLRDVCPCEECRIAQTQEKRFHLATLDSVSIETLTVMTTCCAFPGPAVIRASIQGPFCRDHARATPRWNLGDDYSPASISHRFKQTMLCPDRYRGVSEIGCSYSRNAPTEEATLELLAKRLVLSEVLFERIHNVVDPMATTSRIRIWVCRA